MWLFADNMRAVFWVAVIPGALAVACVLIGVEDRGLRVEARSTRAPIRLGDLGKFNTAFWMIVGVGVVFTLARFSEAFLILRSSDAGLPLALAPLVLVVMNVVYSTGAYPAGVLSDKIAPRFILVAGLAFLVAAALALAFVPGLVGVFIGIGLWGGHMALTQGLFAKLVAAGAPEALRGSAFGVFNLATGIAMLFASVIAGLLWDRIGPAATFVAGAGFAALTATLLLFFVRNGLADANNDRSNSD